MTKNLPVVYQAPAPQDAPEPTWRERQRRNKFNDDAKEIFLTHFRKTFKLGESARVAGVCVQTVVDHRKKDENFAAAMEEARYIYADMVEDAMHKVAIEGTEKITYDKQGNVVSVERIFATNIMAMMAKRANPEYKESTGLDLTLGGGASGVLVVPARRKSAAEEIAATDEYNLRHQKEPGT